MKITNRPDERYEIRLSGTGGQGIITAGMILGEACAFYAGLNTCMTQSYGPEARGGACKAELVFSETEIDAPKVGQADILLALSQKAYDKFKGDIKEWGIIVVDSSIVKFEAAENVFPFPFASVAREKVGFAVTANIVAVGFIAGLIGLVDRETMKKVVARKVPPGTEPTNFKALDFGFDAASEPLTNAGSPASDYLSQNYVSVGLEESMKTAVEKAVAAKTDAVFVVEDGVFKGMFTFFDCLKAVSKGISINTTKVKDIMVEDVLSCHKDDNTGQVLIKMAKKRFKNVPVVDDEGNLLGNFSIYSAHDHYFDDIELNEQIDFIEASRQLLHSGGRWSALKNIAHSVLKSKGSTTVFDCVRKMVQRKTDHIIIVDGADKPVGIFTERDLSTRIIVKDLDPTAIPVSKVMSKRLVFLKNTDTITQAFKKMIKSKIHHMPLINSRGKLVGTVAYASIAKIIHSRFYLFETMQSDQIPNADD